MIRIGSLLCAISRLRPLLGLLALPYAACGGGADLASTQTPGDSSPVDSAPTAPPDTTPSDTTSTVPPTNPPVNPPGSPPDYSGIPVGPAQQPAVAWGTAYSGTVFTPNPDSLLADLEKARRANLRLFLSFTGNEQWNRDENGFSLTKWKQRVDRFRGIDFSSYINDGTIIGHRLLDEPNDKSNWNGKVVDLPTIEEMARYSKEIWPTLPTSIRSFPGYLKAYQFQYLDGAWAAYHTRFGPIDPFIAQNVQDAKEAGLRLIGALNVLNGGSPQSGIPGRREGKFAMSADEIRTWGNKLLDEPSVCALILWEYDSVYFARPDIRAAVQELSDRARTLTGRSCK